jgi:hypothetical protein
LAHDWDISADPPRQTRSDAALTLFQIIQLITHDHCATSLVQLLPQLGEFPTWKHHQRRVILELDRAGEEIRHLARIEQIAGTDIYSRVLGDGIRLGGRTLVLWELAKGT